MVRGWLAASPLWLLLLLWMLSLLPGALSPLLPPLLFVPVPPLALQRRGCARTSPLLKRLVGPAMPRLGTIQITELVRGISWHNVNLQANEPASSFSVRWNMATPAIVSRAPPAMVGTNKNTLMPAFRMRVWRS